MRRLFLTAFLLFGFNFLLWSNCSEKNPLATIEIKPEPPEFPFFDLVLPEKFVQSRDTVAQMALKNLRIADSVNVFRNLLLMPDSTTTFARRSEMDAWASIRRLDTLTISVYLAERTDGINAWLIVLDGIYNGESIDSMNYINARHFRKKQGESYHSVRLETLTPVGRRRDYWYWDFWDNGSITISLNLENDDIYVSIFYHADLSGRIQLTSGGGQQGDYHGYNIDWEADGSGYWEKYDYKLEIVETGQW
ncbi:hypothetical protein JXJ21_24765 [candidate division KSB1 bacterium]|nr:hypothetical protein [candidate division KSB1 bacterium]